MKNPAEIAHGPMLIGFTFNIFLFGMMSTQVYLYYTSFRKDRLWMKLFVLLIFILDTINSVCDCVYLYNSLILHFGDMEVLATANWLFATDPAFTGVIAALVQLFFSWRVAVLTKNWILCAIVVMGALTGGVCGIVTAWEVIRIPHFTEFQTFKVVVIVWLVSASLVDVLITTTLVWHLHKTGFKRSDLVVDRIIRLTVQTGLITSVIAIVDLIVYLADPTGTHLIFNFPLCKLYTNSLMSSLNSRKGWKYSSTSEPSERPGVNADLEGSVGGPVILSQVPDEDDNLRSNKTTGIASRSRAQTASVSHGAKKFTTDLFNVRSKQRTSPEVYVHVESHELRDVSQQVQPPPGVNFEDTSGAKRAPLGYIQETTDPKSGKSRTIVIPVDGFDGRRRCKTDEKEPSIFTESDSDEPKTYPN